MVRWYGDKIRIVILSFYHLTILPSLNGCIDYCKNFGCLSFVSMHVVGNDGVVIDAISFFKQISIFAVTYFHDTFHDHYKLFTFVRGEYEITVFRSSYIDNKRLHVAVRFRLGQGMIFHVLTALDCIIGEADAVFGFRLAADGRTRFILIVKESSQAYTQNTCYFDKWSQ